jgi:hypothetical protein
MFVSNGIVLSCDPICWLDEANRGMDLFVTSLTLPGGSGLEGCRWSFGDGDIIPGWRWRVALPS